MAAWGLFSFCGEKISHPEPLKLTVDYWNIVIIGQYVFPSPHATKTGELNRLREYALGPVGPEIENEQYVRLERAVGKGQPIL